MQMKNYPGVALIGLLAGVFLFGCQLQQEKPTSAQIETVGMKAMQQADASAERKLMSWSAQNMPVAQRELALLYQTRPEQRAQSLKLFEQAARGGDVDAAYQLGEMLRVGVAGVAAVPAAAAPWYEMAARQHHARAALMLGMLYKNGDGVARDDAQAAQWLKVASDLGNPHAMFLLSYIYRDGRGVAQDSVQARHLLEEAAEHEYPPAIQELAMTVQLGDALSPKDERRAGYLLKEAAEHRHNNWNRF
ncbi:sel1 repeat family protein [Rugamonas sp. A1-17]|nr:sel1 repeat family protein [Rugamonas sp. A1-17]